MTDDVNTGAASIRSTGNAGDLPVPTLSDDLRLGAVRLQVGDLARSIAFYSGVLGLRVMEQEAHTATLATEDGGTSLVHLEQRAGTAPLRPHSRLGLYHFALLLPDRAALG